MALSKSHEMYIEGAVVSISSLEKYLSKFNSHEAGIFNARLNQPPISELSNDEVENVLANFIFSSCVCVGCPLPDDIYFLKLKDRLKGLLFNLGYSGLSANELYISLELNSDRYIGESDFLPVEFLNKNMGLEYLANVIKYYVGLRNWFERKVEILIKGYGNKMKFD